MVSSEIANIGAVKNESIIPQNCAVSENSGGPYARITDDTVWLKTSNMNSKQHGHKLSSEVDITPYLNLGNRSEKNGATGFPIHYSTYINFNMETQICKMQFLLSS